MIGNDDFLNISVENKQLKEEANLNLLKERLAKNTQIAKGIDLILNTFEQRLSRLEDTILPVYSGTELLQKSQSNIDQTIHLLENVISYYDVSTEVEGIIERGLGESGSEIAPYLHSLDRLAQAQKYFEEHIPQSVERENVSTLFEKGVDKVNTEFKAILDKYNTPILPIVLLDMINFDDSSKITNVPTVQIPESVNKKLVQISNWFLSHQKFDHLTVYGMVRGYVVQRSLNMLRNHQKSVSGGSVHGVNSSPMSRPKFQNRSEAARKPSTRRLQQVFQGKANRMFLKASQTFEYSTGLSLGTRRASHLDTSYAGEEVDNEQEMENYLITIMALHKLMQIEKNMMKPIVPLTHQARVFELIVRDAMDTIVQDGEAIISRAKKCIGKHEFTTVLVVFPILKQLRALKPDFEKTINDCDLTVKAKFESILVMLHSTGSKALEDFIESLKSDSITLLPSDGTVHELTSNVITFLEQLLDYIDMIGIVLATDPAYAQQIGSTTADQNKALLGLYIKKVLVQLNHTLISKSEQYGDSSLKAIFRLNNNNYILKSLQERSTLLELYLLAEPKCEEYYHSSIQEHKMAYAQSWSKLLNYIRTDDASASLLHSDKLREKDRSVIKEKFAGFNREIEEIAKVQRGYSIPDVQLRESIKRDNKELIIPKYNAFYNMYSGIQFTKNIDKYIKHKPDEVSGIIDRFFDIAA